MSKAEKIRKEIERLKAETFDNKELSLEEIITTRNYYNNILFFIDSLEEPVKRTTADIESAMQEVEDKSKAFTAAHPNGFDISFGEADSELSNDLEEAARKIATRHSHITGDTYYANDAWFFKKGAQWQKQQDQSTIELAEDHAMLAGMEKMKEEMIDKFFKWLAKHWREYVWLTDNDVIHFGHWEYDFRRAMEE